MLADRGDSGGVFIWVVYVALDRPYSFLRSKLNKRHVARDISGTDRAKNLFFEEI